MLLGRLDASGRLRYVGRTGVLTVVQRREVATFVAPSTRAHHPWPQPLPAPWFGQFHRTDAVQYVQVQPVLASEIGVDAAFVTGRRRPQVRHLRLRTDLTPADVPLHDWTSR